MFDLFHTDEKTVVLIDGANLFATAKNLGFDIDFKLLQRGLVEGCDLLRIYYYTALVEEGDRTLLRPLVDWLSYNGFTLITKPAKVITTRDGTTRIKGNMDVEIAVDAIDIASLPSVSDIVLFTGDGDFRYMVENVQRKGVRVTIISSTQTPTSMVADDLRKQCDRFVDLNDWKDQIRKPPRFYAEAEQEETARVEPPNS